VQPEITRKQYTVGAVAVTWLGVTRASAEEYTAQRPPRPAQAPAERVRLEMRQLSTATPVVWAGGTRRT
jgi:hypothetical protein